MPTLKYNGPLPQAEVVGYGHFAPGEEKSIDTKTAIEFDCDPCKDEGWEVAFEEGNKPKGADIETDNAPVREDSPRGPRHTTLRKDND